MKPITTTSHNTIFTFFITTLLLISAPLSQARQFEPAVSSVLTAQQQERDEIYMLLAYAVVYKDWQTDATEPRRGHNIGSIMVDPDGAIVFWARNSNAITDNGTQHGEVRLIRNYLASHETSYLKGYTIYTSLEPCAMCSGMMTLSQLTRTVYGQSDPDYGNALQRLQFDGHSHGGYKPYPRPVISDVSATATRIKLDKAYAAYQQAGGKGLTGWLRSDEAKGIYDKALKVFNNYRVKYPENDGLLKQAKSYYRNEVSDSYVPLGQ